MALSLDASSPAHLNKESSVSMDSSPLLSPSSDKRFWSALRNRVDTLLDNRKLEDPIGWTLRDPDLPPQAPSLREDCLLLLRGFDSISSSMTQFTSTLDTALQGARDLSKPSLSELLHSEPEKPEGEKEEEEEGNKKRVKRKCDSLESSDDQAGLEQKENEQNLKNGKLKKARNLAVSMANKAASLARELKFIKSDLCFMQERCALLEEENRRLRGGFDKGVRPEEDDLVRLQLEALLAEKSRLANENANLTRENQCLHQLVEYHQLTSQDLSASYEQLINGMCLDFSSPPPNNGDDNGGDIEALQTPRTAIFGLSASLDEYYSEEQNKC